MKRQPHLAREFEKRKNLDNNVIRLEEIWGNIIFFPSENKLDILFNDLKGKKLNKIIVKYNKNNKLVCYNFNFRDKSCKNIIYKFDFYISNIIKQIAPSSFIPEIQINFNICFIDAINIAFNKEYSYYLSTIKKCEFFSLDFIIGGIKEKYSKKVKKGIVDNNKFFIDSEKNNSLTFYTNKVLMFMKYEKYLKNVEYHKIERIIEILLNFKYDKYLKILSYLEKEQYNKISKIIFRKETKKSKKIVYNYILEPKKLILLIILEKIVKTFEIKDINIIYNILNKIDNFNENHLLSNSVITLLNDNIFNVFRIIKRNDKLLNINLFFNYIKNIEYGCISSHNFLDIPNIYNDILKYKPNYKFDFSNFNNFDDIHNYLVSILNSFKYENLSLINENNSYYYKILNSYINNVELSFGKICVPQTTHQLLDIGQKMKNCVFSYSKRILNSSKNFIIYIINENEYLYCAEIDLKNNSKSISINEIKGKFNREAEMKHKEELKNVLNNLINFTL